MQKLTPNGISIKQLKKDAKKLKKSENIKLSESLDIISKKHTPFNNWNKLISFCNYHGNTISKLFFYNKSNKNTLITFREKPINFIQAPPGYGKTHLIEKFFIDSFKSDIKIINANINFNFNNPLFISLYKENIYYHLQENYFNLYNIKEKEALIYWNQLYNILDKDISFLILDEIQRFIDLIEEEEIIKLIKKCIDLKITILISTQYIKDELLYKISKYSSNILYCGNYNNIEKILSINGQVLNNKIQGFKHYNNITKDLRSFDFKSL